MKMNSLIMYKSQMDEANQIINGLLNEQSKLLWQASSRDQSKRIILTCSMSVVEDTDACFTDTIT